MENITHGHGHGHGHTRRPTQSPIVVLYLVALFGAKHVC